MTLRKFTQKCLACSLLLGPILSAFSQNIPRDTSYTVESTELKLKKDYPFIEPVKIASSGIKREVVDYVHYANRTLKMELFVSGESREKLMPGIVLVHGGGWRSGSPNLMHPMAIALADLGYLTATIEYRLSPEARYPAAIEDVKKAVQFLKSNAERYHLDTSKIAALGCSAGAQLVSLLGATNRSTRYLENIAPSPDVQAVINIDGLMAFDHPESEEYGTPEKLSSAASWFGARFDEDPELWWEASALTHLDANMPPILFIGSSIPRFQAGRDDAVKKLDSLGVYSEVHLMENSPHSFWLFHPWFEPTVKRVNAFLSKVFANN